MVTCRSVKGEVKPGSPYGSETVKLREEPVGFPGSKIAPDLDR